MLIRSNFSSFPQYFQLISNCRSQITYSYVKCDCSIYFSSILQIWYIEVRISQSISESPLDFEITRVDCSIDDVQGKPQSQKTVYHWYGEEKQTNQDGQYTSHKPKQPAHLPQQGEHNAWTSACQTWCIDCWLVWSLMAQSSILRSCLASQFTT